MEMDITALFQLSYGIYLITSHDTDQKAGCLVNTVFQLTAEPVQIGVSVAKENQTHSVIEKSGTLAVLVMEENAPTKLLGTFGYRTGRDLDKFTEQKWEADCHGDPVTDAGVLAQLSCHVVKSVDLQTHTLFLCEVQEARNVGEGTPMTYRYYRDVKKGKAGKYAPTYVAPEKLKQAQEHE